MFGVVGAGLSPNQDSMKLHTTRRILRIANKRATTSTDVYL